MHWKEYRVMQSRVATGNVDGPRRVFELLDGRVLIEREGAPSRIVDAPFERAKAIALREPRAGKLGWWRTFRRWLARLVGGWS